MSRASTVLALDVSLEQLEISRARVPQATFAFLVFELQLGRMPQTQKPSLLIAATCTDTATVRTSLRRQVVCSRCPSLTAALHAFWISAAIGVASGLEKRVATQGFEGM